MPWWGIVLLVLLGVAIGAAGLFIWLAMQIGWIH